MPLWHGLLTAVVARSGDLGYVPVLVTDACGAGNEEAGQRALVSLHFMGDAFEGKRICVVGGRVERVYKDFVTVTDPGRNPDRVDLLCYFRGAGLAAGLDAEPALDGDALPVRRRHLARGPRPAGRPGEAGREQQADR